MPGITLQQAQAALDAALAAQTAILTGGTKYRVVIPGGGERWLECPPLAEVEASIERWDAQVRRLASGGGSAGPRVYGISI